MRRASEKPAVIPAASRSFFGERSLLRALQPATLRKAVAGLLRERIVGHKRFASKIVALSLTQPPHPVTKLQVRLGEACLLGRAGQELSLRPDATILPSVVATGAWKPHLIDFIRDHARRVPYTLIDVGASSGLFSRQVLLSEVTISRVVCFEPHPQNASCLRKNLAPWASLVELHEIGLSVSDGEALLHEDTLNHGHCSMDPDMISDSHRNATEITLRAAREQLEQLQLSAPIVWKSDTKGHDVAIIAASDERMWKLVELATIERRPGLATNQMIELFAMRLSHFKHLRIHGLGAFTLDRVKRILTRGRGQRYDLLAW